MSNHRGGGGGEASTGQPRRGSNARRYPPQGPSRLGEPRTRPPRRGSNTPAESRANREGSTGAGVGEPGRPNDQAKPSNKGEHRGKNGSNSSKETTPAPAAKTSSTNIELKPSDQSQSSSADSGRPKPQREPRNLAGPPQRSVERPVPDNDDKGMVNGK